MMYGETAVGKSFVALDDGLSVAIGSAWCGRKVVSGPVVYLAGEGLIGLRARIVAWKAGKPDEVERALERNFVAIDAAISLLDENHVRDLLAALAKLERKPILIVIDTLARFSGSGDENQAADMNQIVAGCQRLIDATGATVVLLHHKGYAAERSRGSSALPAACDTIIKIERDGDGVVLKCEKQKDSVPFEPIRLRWQVEFIEFDADGREAWSRRPELLTPDESNAQDPVGKAAPNSTVGKSKILGFLKSIGANDARSLKEIEAALQLKRSTCDRAIKALEAEGSVEHTAAERPARYRIKRLSQEVISP
jgi:hypothetical protein